MKKVSIVVPMFNEEAGIVSFVDGELWPAVARQGFEVEIILVDDGSTDGTVGRLKDLKSPVKLVKLTRNFGKEVALSAGIDFATGNAVVIIDADGQHPAEMIIKMVKRWEAGAPVVTAVRGQNTTKHRLSSKLYYRLLRMMGNKNLMEGELDFRLMDRQVIEEFKRMPEHNRLTRGLVDWLGFEQEYVKVKTRGRMNGKPTYSRRKLMEIASDSMVSMSRTPLVIFGYIGLMITAISLVLGLFILVQQYILGDPLGLDWSGAVAMSVFVSFLVGLVLISQAITALYISQIHAEAKGRPLYVVDYRKSKGIKESGTNGKK